MLEEYPALKERKQINYRMELWRSFDEIKERISELNKTKRGVPILLFFYDGSE